MKNGACFLNLSRGFVVDHEALAACLKSGKIAGAAIDVFPERAGVGRGIRKPAAGIAQRNSDAARRRHPRKRRRKISGSSSRRR